MRSRAGVLFNQRGITEAPRGDGYHQRVPDLFVVLVIVLVIVLVVRGPKTLPQIGAMLGRGVKEARREANELRQKSDDEAPTDRPA